MEQMEQMDGNGQAPTAARGELVLYVRRGCHLCAEADALLAPLLQRSQRDMQRVDVDDDADLAARYGLRLPVLVCDGRELCWGRFDGRVLSALLLPKGGWWRKRSPFTG